LSLQWLLARAVTTAQLFTASSAAGNEQDCQPYKCNQGAAKQAQDLVAKYQADEDKTGHTSQH
jgi:hypothetical protein